METAQRAGLTAAILAFCVAGAGCAGPVASSVSVIDAPAVAETPPTVVELPVQPEPQVPPLSIRCSGPAKQGGAILCRTSPGADVSLDGQPIAVAGEDGVALVGLRRDAPATVQVSARAGEGSEVVSASVEVQPRKDEVSKLSMECNKIAAQTPEEKRHAEVSWVKKDKALKVFAPPLAAVGMIKPAEGPYSSPYGATRTYVPKTKDCEGTTNVHNGQDIAIATGTEIRAPMAGTVLLADPDLYYEGGAVFLDLGRGLVSVTMHMSRVDVKAGDTVAQSQLLGLSGSTGRVTGPHLHWGLKYRNIHSDDRGTDIWLDPVLLLGLTAPD